MESKKIKDKDMQIQSLCETYNQLRIQEGAESERFETLKSIAALLGRKFLRNPSLCYNMGYAYYEGWGGTEDYDLALYYFQKAAKEDYPLADFFIGMIYMEQEEYKKSVPYYKKALDVDPLASYNLGVYYEEGMGVRRNLKEAVRYYKLAVKGEYPHAFHNLASFYRRGMGDLKQDYKKAMSLYKKAIKMQDDPLSYHALAQMYFNGFGVKQNKKRALELLQIGAEKGGKEAKYSLGLYYFNKWLYGAKQYEADGDNGVRLIKEAKHDNYIPAALWIFFRIIYNDSFNNVSSEPQIKTLEYYANLDEVICPEQYLYLGYIYQNGCGVDKDVEKARKLLLKGIQSEYTHGAIEDPLILHYLSRQYSGDGIFKKNPQREEEYRSRWLDYYRGADYIGKSKIHEPIVNEETYFKWKFK